MRFTTSSDDSVNECSLEADNPSPGRARDAQNNISRSSTRFNKSTRCPHKSFLCPKHQNSQNKFQSPENEFSRSNTYLTPRIPKKPVCPSQNEHRQNCQTCPHGRTQNTAHESRASYPQQHTSPCSRNARPPPSSGKSKSCPHSSPCGRPLRSSSPLPVRPPCPFQNIPQQVRSSFPPKKPSPSARFGSPSKSCCPSARAPPPFPSVPPSGGTNHFSSPKPRRPASCCPSQKSSCAAGCPSQKTFIERPKCGSCGQTLPSSQPAPKAAQKPCCPPKIKPTQFTQKLTAPPTDRSKLSPCQRRQFPSPQMPGAQRDFQGPTGCCPSQKQQETCLPKQGSSTHKCCSKTFPCPVDLMSQTFERHQFVTSTPRKNRQDKKGVQERCSEDSLDISKILSGSAIDMFLDTMRSVDQEQPKQTENKCNSCLSKGNVTNSNGLNRSLPNKRGCLLNKQQENMSSKPGTEAGSKVADFFMTTINQNSIVIFSKSTCPYSDMAKEVFQNMNKCFKAIELDMIADGQCIMKHLTSVTQCSTVPQVFIRGMYIGGGQKTKQLYERGELQRMLD